MSICIRENYDEMCVLMFMCKKCISNIYSQIINPLFRRGLKKQRVFKWLACKLKYRMKRKTIILYKYRTLVNETTVCTIKLYKYTL